MADSATTRNRFRKQEVGAKTNAWGGDWNEDGGSDRLDEALDGVLAFTLSGTKTLTSTNYETDEARMRVLSITSGTGGTVEIPAVEKWYLVRNNTSGSVIFTAGGTTATVPTGAVVPIFCNGSTVYASDLSAYVTACQTAQTAAELAETNAETAATNAQTAETNAETAETNASAYATAAANSAVSAANAASSVIGTSTTSLAIATGSKTFTTQSGKNWQVGSYVIAASAANPANYMFGQVTSYSTTTLIVDVQAIGGSGTLADWNISLAGARGATGAAGAPGATGPVATWTQIATSTTTGSATIDFTSIPSTYSDLLIVIAGVSTSAGNALLLKISNDNGSTWSANPANSLCGSASAGSETFYGGWTVVGYTKSAGFGFGRVENLSANGLANGSSAEPFAWRESGGINAVRVYISSGTIDVNGGVTLYGR